MHGDVDDVRDGEQLNWSALAAYLRWHLADHSVPGLRLDAEMQVAQFVGGHSNLTYLIRLGGAEFVLRRPPLGPVTPGAHDMAREFHWLAALHPVFPLAPRPFLLCEDQAVIGSEFYLMERRRGMVVRDEEPVTLAGHAEARRRLSHAAVDTLALLHGVDITRGSLPTLGEPAGFLDRQVRRWIERWQRVKLETVPDMDAVALWLTAHQPPETLAPAVVHGDFKVDNLLLNPLDPSEVLAVFDWEMAAAGDPLLDLGIMLACWEPTPGGDTADALAPVTGREGYASRDELINRYAISTGRDVADIDFYEALAVFAAAVVTQQHCTRHRAEHAAAPRFAALSARVSSLAARARRLAG